jgi:hypothetical protein
MTQPSRLRTALIHLIVFGFYLTVAAFITWPLVTVISERYIGHPFADSYEYARHIWWINHALRTGEPIFRQPLLAYPDGLNGAWLWGNPLQSFPAWLFAFVMPLPAAFNISFLLTLALNGWTLHWLMWKRTGLRGPALLAGLIFMAAPTFQGHMAAAHIGLLTLWPTPFYVYALLRLRATLQIRWVFWGALWLLIGSWGNMLLLAFVLLPITALFVLTILICHEWAVLGRLIVIGVIGGSLALLFIVPVAIDQLNMPDYVRESGSLRYNADLLSIVTPSFQHPFFGQFEYTHRVLGLEPFEKAGYIGIIAALLAIVGVWKTLAARWWLLLAAIAWVLSLGPLLVALDEPVMLETSGYSSYVPLPWALLENIPLLNIARTPARFNFVLALALAVMAGYGAAYVWARFNRRVLWLLLIPLMIGVLWEYQLFWPQMPTIRGEVPDEIAALSERGDVRAVFDIPWQHLLVDKEAMFLQTGHELPLIAGHVTRRTPVSPAMLTILQSTLDAALLDAAGVDVIILHKQWTEDDGALEAFVRERLGDPFFENDRYAAFNAPEANAEAEFTVSGAPCAARIGGICFVNITVPRQFETYLFAPEMGWARLTATLTAADRTAALYLDSELLHSWSLDSSISIDQPIPLAERDYHTLTLALEPPCPEYYDETTLACRTLAAVDLTIGDFTPDRFRPIEFEHGLSLRGWRLVENAQAGETLPINLWWSFTEPRTENDIRFVHVLDSNGEPVVQSDESLGARPAFSSWMETVNIDLPVDLAPAAYRVVTGWYTYPDLVRFCLSSDMGEGVDCSANGLADLGTVIVN